MSTDLIDAAWAWTQYWADRQNCMAPYNTDAHVKAMNRALKALPKRPAIVDADLLELGADSLDEAAHLYPPNLQQALRALAGRIRTAAKS